MSAPFIYKSKKNGKMYFFARRMVGKNCVWFYFATSNPNGALTELPEGYYIQENIKNGVPQLKKRISGITNMSMPEETDTPQEA